jgi:hypothetical protein
MARMTVGAWIRQVLGGRGTGAQDRNGSPRVGMQVITNEGVVLGTITAVWRGVDATDGATHEDTLGVQRTDGDDAGLLYIPSGAIARLSDKGAILTVGEAQVGPRGWRFRPTWLHSEDPQ